MTTSWKKGEYLVYHDCRIIAKTKSEKKAMKKAKGVKGWVLDWLGAWVADYREDIFGR